jgi:hypothetical protein
MPHLDLPPFALSVRQPWAWAIIHAGKDIENRSWRAVNHGLTRRGRYAIHASKGMTREEYVDASEFMLKLRIECPPAHKLLRGGIIGSVEVIDVVTESESPWFFGPRGLVLKGAEPCAFIPAAGALGYFEWKPGDASIVPEAARWMMPSKAADADQPFERTTQGTLL